MKVNNGFIKITKEDGLKNIYHSDGGQSLAVGPYQDMAIVFQITDIHWTKNANLINANGEHQFRYVSIQKSGLELGLSLTPQAFESLEEIIFKN